MAKAKGLLPVILESGRQPDNGHCRQDIGLHGGLRGSGDGTRRGGCAITLRVARLADAWRGADAWQPVDFFARLLAQRHD
jgi:hypothetical protein